MDKPQPRVGALNRPFWEGCNAGRLMLQRCPACRRAIFYPRVCCPFCRHGELEWFEASGRGTIVSHTTVHRTHHDGFNGEAPYVFGAIALAEGPLMYGQVLEAPLENEVLIGRGVRAQMVPHGPGLSIPAFRLA